MEAEFGTATLVNKVYPRDHPKPRFLDQSNHPLAAAAETPFLTTGLRADFRLGSPRSPGLFGGIAVERRKILDAARDNFLFARHSPGIRDRPDLAPGMIASTDRVVARSCANSQTPTGSCTRDNSGGKMKVIETLQRTRATIAVTSSDCFPALN
jgi:hypothetical protein